MLGIHRDTLSFKMTFLYVVLAIVIISVFNFIIWENQSDLLVENQKWIVESQSIKLRQIVEKNSSKYKSNPTKVYRRISEVANSINIIQTEVFSENGQTLFNSEKNVSNVDVNKELILINRCLARFELENKQFLYYTDLEKNVINMYIPKSIGAGTQIVFKFVTPLIGFSERKNEVFKICLLIGVFIMFLQLVMALVVRRLIIKPIHKLVKMTNLVSSGNLDQMINIEQNDEIGQLANAYNDMVLNLNKMQKEAKGANPLSGLPGNISIMNDIDQRLQKNEKIAIVYGDLDNFKAYNDKYGLTKGDEAILHSKNVFLLAVNEIKAKDCFIGHEGGDDFVIICPYRYWEGLCKAIIKHFDAGVPMFYTDEDNLKGYIDSKDRLGNPVRFPLMSISLAVVSNNFRRADDHRILISWAAEMKKVAKKKEGSSYAIDLRRS